MRFCTSKAITEVLLASARREALATELVRRCQSRVTALSEQAMDLSLRGEVSQAVELLLDQGARTLNAKWLEMAGLIARRNRDRWPDAEASAQRAAQLLARSCATVSHIAGIQRSGRSPGGLQLRGKETGLTSVEVA